MSELKELLSRIGELDAGAMAQAQERQNRLTKPPGSLGLLEQISIRLAGISGDPLPRIGRKTVVVMAGDHGVAAEGVSAFPSEVTAQMVANFVNGGAAINVLAAHEGVEVVVVDMGVNGAVAGDGVWDRKIKAGAGNIARGPAMSREEAAAAILAGAAVAEQLIESGVSLLATGDMGIANTTPSSALVAVLGGFEPEEVTGRGTGIDEAGLRKKLAAVHRAIEVNRPDPGDALDVLAKVGGLEIAGLVGLILGCAANRRPVVIDGFISGAAALAAARLEPKSVHYMIGSHLSVEPGHRRALTAIGLSPMLHMDMRLGEGTGAVLAMNLVEASAKVLLQMATFAEAGVADRDARKTDAAGLVEETAARPEELKT
jgi:nicotinate-nucleotide--dimethylbenzimidazole phosphoribosyltransferase